MLELVLAVFFLVVAVLFFMTFIKGVLSDASTFEKMNLATSGNALATLRGEVGDSDSYGASDLLTEGMAFDVKKNKFVRQANFSDETIQKIGF